MAKLNLEKLRSNLEKAAEYDFANQKVFGSAYWVAQNGQVAAQKCFGVQDPESGTPVTEKTLFRLASMSKPVTAMAALILIDRNQLSLTDPVEKYLPEFAELPVISMNDAGELVNLGPAKNPATVEHLLTHTSGIGSDDRKMRRMTDADKESVDATVAFLQKNGYDFEPGSKQQYSGFGAFDVMVKIIELVSGTDFLSFLKKEIFEPCGMPDTTFVPNEEQETRLIAMHRKENGVSCVEPMPENCIFADIPCTHFLGGAGLVSTLADYSKFVEMLRNRGKVGETRLVSDENFSLLCTPRVSKTVMQGNERWGLGVRVITEPEYGVLPVGTFGWSGAYGTHMWVDPVNGVAAVYLKNSKFDGGAANESARNFEKAVKESFEE